MIIYWGRNTWGDLKSHTRSMQSWSGLIEFLSSIMSAAAAARGIMSTVDDWSVFSTSHFWSQVASIQTQDLTKLPTLFPGTPESVASKHKCCKTVPEKTVFWPLKVNLFSSKRKLVTKYSIFRKLCRPLMIFGPQNKDSACLMTLTRVSFKNFVL